MTPHENGGDLRPRGVGHRVQRRRRAWRAVTRGVALGTAAFLGLAAAAPGGAERTILFFGDSLTAGYGVEKTQAYPALIQDRLDSLGWGFRVVNAGLDGETSAAGLRRVDWILRRPVDVFVLELGGNDGLRGLPLEQTEQNLQQILDRVMAKRPSVELVIAGMRLPPNLGPQYTGQFSAIFPRLAERNKAALIPFLLAGVAGVEGADGLMQADGIHPTAAGHERVAEVVWSTLAPTLRRIRSGSVDSLGAAQDLQGRRGHDAAAAGEPDQHGEQGDGDTGE